MLLVILEAATVQCLNSCKELNLSSSSVELQRGNNTLSLQQWRKVSRKMLRYLTETTVRTEHVIYGGEALKNSIFSSYADFIGNQIKL